MSEQYGPYRAHEVAAWFPLLGAEEMAALVQSIRDNGQLEAIEVCGDVLIDGRNRWRACEAAGVEPRVREIIVGDETAYILARNLDRRHLTESQRALMAARRLDYFRARARERQRAGGDAGRAARYGDESGSRSTDLEPERPVQARDEAAQALGVSPASVERAARVLERGAPELVQAIEDGTVSVRDAASVAAEPVEVQRAAVRAKQEGETRTVAEAVKRAHVANNSGNNEWYTPEEWIEMARCVLGDIDLDPASSAIANERVKASTFFDEQANGLSRQWRGRVWLNPPYAQPLISQFIAKLVDEAGSGNVSSAIVLVNNGTETQWGQTLLGAADAVLFPSKRIRFVAPDGTQGDSPLQGQMVVYIGHDVEKFQLHAGDRGVVLIR